VLRHQSVRQVIMCDIDKMVVDTARAHLQEWGQRSETDKRVQIFYTDAKEYLRNYTGTFDVIIMDICDPIEGGDAVFLYTQEFYKMTATKLSVGGVLVTNSGACDILPSAKPAAESHDQQKNKSDVQKRDGGNAAASPAAEDAAKSSSSDDVVNCCGVIFATLRTVFEVVIPYVTYIPSYSSLWGFNIAYNRPLAKVPVPSTLEIKGDVASHTSFRLRAALEEPVFKFLNRCNKSPIVKHRIAESSVLPKTPSAVVEPAKAGSEGGNSTKKKKRRNRRKQKANGIQPKDIASNTFDVVTGIDDLIASRIGKGKLRYYDGETHVHTFYMSLPLRNLIYNENRVMTNDSPVFMFDCHAKE